MLLGKRQRKVILIVGTALGGLSLLGVSLPLWFPWVATPLARKQGIHFARYERLSYNRFALHDLAFTNKDVRLRAWEVEAFVPTIWLWKLSSTNMPSPFVRVSGWEVETLLATNKTGASSTYTNAQEIAAILQTVQRWLPAATLSNGTVSVQKTVLKIPAAIWARGKVEAQLGISGLQQADVSATLPPRSGYDLQIRSEALKLDSTFHLSMDSSSVTLQATNLWHTNQVEFQARFGREGALPESASLKAHDFRFAGELIGLKEYGDIRGSVSAK